MLNVLAAGTAMGGGLGAPVPVAVRVQDLAPGRALAQ